MSMRSALSQQFDRMRLKLDQLSPRDRLALLIMMVFLLLVAFGGGVWYLHQAANKAQQRATEQRELLLWMRSQVGNVELSAAESEPLNVAIQNTAQQQGLTVNPNAVGTQAQVTATHPSFAVLGTWLTRLAQQGITIDQLSIEQLSSGELQLKAVLQ